MKLLTFFAIFIILVTASACSNDPATITPATSEEATASTTNPKDTLPSTTAASNQTTVTEETSTTILEETAETEVVPLPEVSPGDNLEYENVSGIARPQIGPDGALHFVSLVGETPALATLSRDGILTEELSNNALMGLIVGGKNFAFYYDEPDEEARYQQYLSIEPGFIDPQYSSTDKMMIDGLYDIAIQGQMLNNWEMDIVVPQWCGECTGAYQQILHVAETGAVETLAAMPVGFIPNPGFAATNNNELWIVAGHEGVTPAAGGIDKLVVGQGTEIISYKETSLEYPYPEQLATDGKNIIGIAADETGTFWRGIRYENDEAEVYEFKGMPETTMKNGEEIAYFTDSWIKGLYHTNGLWVMPIQFRKYSDAGSERVEFWISPDAQTWTLYDVFIIEDNTFPTIAQTISGGRILVFHSYAYGLNSRIDSLTKLTIIELP